MRNTSICIPGFPPFMYGVALRITRCERLAGKVLQGIFIEFYLAGRVPERCRLLVKNIFPALAEARQNILADILPGNEIQGRILNWGHVIYQTLKSGPNCII